MKKVPRANRKEPCAPCVIILAAGVGSRMRSTLPKVLHRVGGVPLLEAVLRTARSVDPSRIVVVLGPARARIEPVLSGQDVTIAVQDPPRGTGDAVRCALPALDGEAGPVVVLSGDVPLIRPDTLRALLDRRRDGDLDLAFLTFRPPDAGDLGRVVRDGRRRVRRIVEARNATPRERAIGEVNAGVYCFAPASLARAIRSLKVNRASGEIYLTDAVEALASGRGRVETLEAPDWTEAWGINTRRDLAGAEEIARRRELERALDSGATLIDPASTRIGVDVVIEPDVVLHPFVALDGRTVLREGCEILSFTRIADSEVAAGAVIGPHCELEGARVGARCRVGPFARLRPETVLEDDVRVGNFVEIKKSVLRRGVKALHLSYLGDAQIGEDVNIGAGVITCNYDGQNKNATTIGAGAFVGSDTQLVAPVTVGEGAYVGAGSTITRDVPPGALAVTRVRQENHEGWVERRRQKKTRGRGDSGTR